jgi:hypothetical protein
MKRMISTMNMVLVGIRETKKRRLGSPNRFSHQKVASSSHIPIERISLLSLLILQTTIDYFREKFIILWTSLILYVSWIDT